MNDQPDGSEFARPDHLLDRDSPFDATDPPASRGSAGASTAPPVSPDDAQAFGAPAPDQPFDPAAGDRIAPRHDSARQPVSREMVDTYAGRTGEPFEAEPGTRIAPSKPGPGSPWWNKDAAADPWRDPQSPYWIAGRPVFSEDDELIGLDDSELEPADAEDDVPKSKRPRGRLGLSALAIMLVGALFAGVIGGGVGYWLSQRAHRVLTDPNVKLAQVGTPANRPPGSVAEIAQRVSPAVVSIDVRSADAAGSGSGVIIDGGGYILTNNHVVSFAAKGTIRVIFSDKSSAPAKVVGTDPQNDLAVVKVDKTSLTVAALGNSDSLAVGDPVVAIGDPLGLRGTVTAGIVSTLHRPLRLPGENGEPDAVIDAIQTDAPINPGNSGGALVDASGAVVGINTAILSLGQSASGGQAGSIGIGFAIPIDTARTVAQELIRTGKVVHADMGVSSRSVTDGSRDGAYLVQIVPNGPADKAGLKEGDVITLYDQTLIDSGDALTVAVSESKPGAQVTVHYVRAGVSAQTKVTLGSD
ncbi:MAG: Peptidase and chymotrypsin/Hap [Frankiales bacterium]|nr:Peptidase and chymotrypsin/Hap [Frankiales bacterium]